MVESQAGGEWMSPRYWGLMEQVPLGKQFYYDNATCDARTRRGLHYSFGTPCWKARSQQRPGSGALARFRVGRWVCRLQPLAEASRSRRRSRGFRRAADGLDRLHNKQRTDRPGARCLRTRGCTGGSAWFVHRSGPGGGVFNRKGYECYDKLSGDDLACGPTAFDSSDVGGSADGARIGVWYAAVGCARQA